MGQLVFLLGDPDFLIHFDTFSGVTVALNVARFASFLSGAEGVIYGLAAWFCWEQPQTSQMNFSSFQDVPLMKMFPCGI